MLAVKRLFFSLLIVGLLLSTPQVAFAGGNQSPGLLPPSARPQGKTLGEWSAEVFQAIYETPVSENPFLGDPDHHCAYKLDGHMALLWTDPFETLPYSCSVPSGVMLTIPVMGWFCDTVVDTNGDVSALRKCVDDNYDAAGFTNFQGSIDGKELKDLERYLVVSPPVKFKMPADNIFGYPEGIQGSLMVKGVNIITNPLSVGEHTFHFQADIPGLGVTVDFTLLITATHR